MVAEQKPRHSAVNQTLVLQRSIGNQAMHRLQTQRPRDTHNETGACEIETDPTGSTPQTAAPVPSWDFSKIPIFARQELHGPTPIAGSILQRAWGNRAVAGGECVAELKVNQPDDVYEQEADRIAEHVMTMPTHAALRGTTPHIQRHSGQSNDPTDVAPVSVNRALASPGRPLEQSLRQDMEQRFGYDFSRVRVHFGSAAERSARDLNARAYTVGHNIVFGAGSYIRDTDQGRRLIAHELTHVLQQAGSAGNPPRVQRDVPKPETAAAKLQVVKDKLKAKYGLEEISEQHGVSWTESELTKIDAAFSKMRPEEQKRLQGVTLVLTDKLPPIKRKGRTIPIAGITYGTSRVELTHAGVKTTTPIHEAGHLIHNTAIANAEKIFERSQFKADLETARLMYSVAALKRPTFSGDPQQMADFEEFKKAAKQVDTAAYVFESSRDDDLKTNRDALEQAVLDLQTHRSRVEQFGPGAKAVLGFADLQSAFVDALLLWSDEKEKAVGPIKNLDEFVSIVKKDKLDRRSFAPFTSYAEANWPDHPQEFFAEAYQSWRNNPGYMEEHGRALFNWFQRGGHLGPAAPPPPTPRKPVKIPRPKLPATLHEMAPVIEELLIEAGETFSPAVEGGENLIP
jgi:hypothetical protein